MTIRSKTPSMLPRIAPSAVVERPWPLPRAPVVDGDEEDEVEDRFSDVGAGVEACNEVWVGMDVGGDVVVKGVDVGEGVATELPVKVDGGGVRPPYVHTPSVPSGICKTRW